MRALLRECQASQREQWELDQLCKATRAELKKAKAVWSNELAKRGLRLQGYEVRGWRGWSNGGAHRNGPSVDKTVDGFARESDKH